MNKPMYPSQSSQPTPPQPSRPDFQPRPGEGQQAAGTRVREAVRDVVRRNGGKPAGSG